MGSDEKVGAAGVLKLAETQSQTRRHFLRSCSTGLGGLYLATLNATQSAVAAAAQTLGRGSQGLDVSRSPTAPMEPLPPQFRPRVRRIIYLHMVGAPSQFELFEYKPELIAHDGQDCPVSFLEGMRFAFLRGAPKLLGSQYPFHQAGQSGAWISDRLPYLEQHIDSLCFVRSMHTEQFNHAPAQLLVHTGDARFGSASLGSWVTYGLGTENQNLPGYVVLLSGGKTDGGKRLWGSGFLPSVYQGVQCRSVGDPVLYLGNPSGVSRRLRRYMLDALADVNQRDYEEFGDPETVTRVAQYETAFRMQMEASDALDFAKEPESVRAAYGATPGEASFANNCLVARRLAERGVRYVQLFDAGWDSHGGNAHEALNIGFRDKCMSIDKPIAALLGDLKSRGLMEDTLVIWGGEFGRTPMRETRQTPKLVGRDHHPGAFTIWMAGGGVKSGLSYGETDEFGYDVVKDPVQVRDLHATLLYLLGFDHEDLIYPFQGLDRKITGVKPARVVTEIVA